MLNLRHLYLTVKDYIVQSNISDITSANIYGPNEKIPSTGNGLIIEINILQLTRGVNKSERMTVSPVMVNIFITVPVDSGDGYASHISALIASRFSEQSPDKMAFALPVGYMHVRGIDQLSGFVENNRYRLTIQVLFDVYEQR